ncbi:MAG TPA: DUF4350 domain-containing protein, partial [Candidatus Binataceae bacterium]|nr:DUF4350 domain-containing protein [Candidatus Binataceae bacterium]
MNPIPKRILIPTGALVVLLLALNFWLQPNEALQQSPTSFGIMRDGYKAAFDLLSEMDFPVTRSYRRPNLIPPTQTVWFVAPSFLYADKPSAHDDAHEVIEWAMRGGTAVIFGESGSNWKVLGTRFETESNSARTLIEGGPLPRWIDVPELLSFTKQSAAQEKMHVRLTADGKPFVLEKDVGKNRGRLILIADAA